MSEGVARRSLHYAWIIASVTFVILLVTAGVRATPGVLMLSLEREFGWSRAVISSAVAINIALFGLIGPFAASVMDRLGVRRVILAAVALLCASVALTTQMQSQWQLTLLWGVLVGTGTGVTSMVLAAIIANRWFDERRGLVLGVLSAANATGQLIFLPSLAGLVESHGWRSAAMLVSGAAAVVFVVVLIFMRDRPEDLGLLPYGRPAGTVIPQHRGRAASGARAGVTNASVLAAGRNVFRVRRKHERPHRHAPHCRVPRLRDS
jgi:sugar phosphate permease